MTTQQIIAFNERAAIEKIRAAYAVGDLAGAMHLVSTCMGIDDAKAAYNKVMGICFDLTKEGKAYEQTSI